MVVLLLAAGVGCDTEDDWNKAATEEPFAQDRPARGAGSPDQPTEFLRVTSQISPAQWLASLEQNGIADPAVSRVRAFNAALVQLSERYFEDPRMIANRTVQLQHMLSEEAINVDLMGILTGMERVDRAGPLRSYGELCSHYFNIRVGGRSHEETVTTLVKIRGGES